MEARQKEFDDLSAKQAAEMDAILLEQQITIRFMRDNATHAEEQQIQEEQRKEMKNWFDAQIRHLDSVAESGLKSKALENTIPDAKKTAQNGLKEGKEVTCLQSPHSSDAIALEATDDFVLFSDGLIGAN
ncbi:hypothetical protein CJ030_MR3G017033 [Morella rubra]|uniref:Uncharacterized protein n=1 Tax=Morella rubra TaxID=262757 RepID=A0A6A1W4N8_9ROSI|nr:hypothetical protein CJ030_MR3G017033 [Morella rubra]